MQYLADGIIMAGFALVWNLCPLSTYTSSLRALQTDSPRAVGFLSGRQETTIKLQIHIGQAWL